MELKEHLKMAFQTEVQLHVLEHEVLPKWKQAEEGLRNTSETLTTTIESAQATECSDAKKPEQLKAEVDEWGNALCEQKCAELEQTKLKLWENDSFRAKYWDKSYQEYAQAGKHALMKSYDRNPNKEDAVATLAHLKAQKYNVFTLLGEMLTAIFLGLLIEAIVLIALFGAYFGTGAQYKALLIIPLVLIGLAVLIGAKVGISNFSLYKGSNLTNIQTVDEKRSHSGFCLGVNAFRLQSDPLPKQGVFLCLWGTERLLAT